MEGRKIGNLYSLDKAKDYYKLYGTEVESSSDLDRFFLSLIPESLDGKVALDLGAGNGRHAELLHNRGAERVIALDLSESMLQGAANRKREKSLAHLDLVRTDIEKLPFENQSIDYALSRFSVMYTKDLPKLMEKISNILKEDGEILIQANVATIQNPEDKEKIQSAPVPLLLKIGDKSVEIQNYANTLEDYFSAFQSAGLTIETQHQFPADELSVNKGYEYAEGINFQYIVFRLKKNKE